MKTVTVLDLTCLRRHAGCSGAAGNVSADTEADGGLDDQVQAGQDGEGGGSIAPRRCRRRDAEPYGGAECQQDRR